MIKFSGRSKMKVYMPLKPIKYGFKAYILAESSSGYMLNWKMHEGKKTTVKNIIEDLVTPYKNRSYIISMDRFYTTYSAVQYLTENDFGVYGAAMRNRINLNQEMKNQIKTLKKHESLFYTSICKSMLLSVWYDSKVVYLLSNIGDNNFAEIQRKKKIKEHELTSNTQATFRISNITCPNTIKRYSQTSHGVDFLDQMISYYQSDNKSRKWYMPIVTHLLQISLYNSFILYRKAKKKNMSFITYQESVIRSLIAPMRTIKSICVTPKKSLNYISLPIEEKQNNSIQINNEGCFLAKSDVKPCQICNKEGHVLKRTSFICSTHKKYVCVIPCYSLHLNNLDK